MRRLIYPGFCDRSEAFQYRERVPLVGSEESGRSRESRGARPARLNDIRKYASLDNTAHAAFLKEIGVDSGTA